MTLFIISLFTGGLGAFIGTLFGFTTLGGIIGFMLPISIAIEGIYSRLPADEEDVVEDELTDENLQQYGVCPSCGEEIVEGDYKCPSCGLILTWNKEK